MQTDLYSTGSLRMMWNTYEFLTPYVYILYQPRYHVAAHQQYLGTRRPTYVRKDILKVIKYSKFSDK